MEYKQMLQKAYRNSKYKNIISFTDYDKLGMFLMMHTSKLLELTHLPQVNIRCLGKFIPYETPIKRAIAFLETHKPERVERIEELKQSLLPKQNKFKKRPKK